MGWKNLYSKTFGPREKKDRGRFSDADESGVGDKNRDASVVAGFEAIAIAAKFVSERPAES